MEEATDNGSDSSLGAASSDAALGCFDALWKEATELLEASEFLTSGYIDWDKAARLHHSILSSLLQRQMPPHDVAPRRLPPCPFCKLTMANPRAWQTHMRKGGRSQMLKKRCFVMNVPKQTALGLPVSYLAPAVAALTVTAAVFSRRYSGDMAEADLAASTSAAPATADASKAADVEVSLSLLRRQHEDLERELAALMSAIALKEQAPKLLDAPSCVGVRFHHDCRAHTRLTRATPLFGLAADS